MRRRNMKNTQSFDEMFQKRLRRARVARIVSARV